MASSSVTTAQEGAQNFMPTRAVMDGWASLTQVVDWAGLRQEQWKAMEEFLGDPGFDDLPTFAGLEDEDFIELRNQAKLPRLHKAAANRLFFAVKAKYNLATKVISQMPTTADTLSAAAKPQP